MRYSDLKTSKFTKKCMASGRRVGQRPDCNTFLCKFWHFQLAVSQWKVAWLTPNLGILWISLSSFWLCESIVANPIIYRLVPRPSRLETRQFWQVAGLVAGRWRMGQNEKDWVEKCRKRKWWLFFVQLWSCRKSREAFCIFVLRKRNLVDFLG